jgi:hypothetical protein
MRILILFMLIFCAFSNSVEASNKTPIDIEYNGDDLLGKRLYYEISDAIKRCEEFRLTSINEPRILMRIHTMDIDKEKTSVITIYCIVWISYTKTGTGFYPIFMEQLLGFCLEKYVAIQAKDILEQTKKQIPNYLRLSNFSPIIKGRM